MAWDDDEIRGPGGIRYGVWIPRDPNYVKKEAPKAPEPPKAPADDWIKIKVVDDQSGEVIPRVKLVLKTPDNSTEEHETRLSGLIESLGLQSGNCEVSCELKDATLENTLPFVGVGEKPIGQKGTNDSNSDSEAAIKPGTKYIAAVEEHKVKTGETLESIAKSIGITWQDLAKFNWGTDNSEEIHKHLHSIVGCTNKTADRKSYKLDDSDKPGIIYMPKQSNLPKFATNQVHVIRVRPVVQLTKLRVLHMRLHMSAKEAAALEEKFRLFSRDGTFEQEKTVADDCVEGDDFLDFEFSGVPVATP